MSLSLSIRSWDRTLCVNLAFQRGHLVFQKGQLEGDHQLESPGAKEPSIVQRGSGTLSVCIYVCHGPRSRKTNWWNWPNVKRGSSKSMAVEDISRPEEVIWESHLRALPAGIHFSS